MIVVLQHTQMLRHRAVHHGHPSFIGLVILKIQAMVKHYKAVMCIEFKTQVKYGLPELHYKLTIPETGWSGSYSADPYW